MFSLFFTQKCEKLHYARPMANSKGCKSGSVKDRRGLFSQNCGFSGSRNRMVSFKYTLYLNDTRVSLGYIIYYIPQTDHCCHFNQT